MHRTLKHLLWDQRRQAQQHPTFPMQEFLKIGLVTSKSALLGQGLEL